MVLLGIIFVYLRFLYAEEPFSYDYAPYLNIILGLSNLSYREIFGYNLVFPYVVVQGVIPVEFGFSLAVKTISLFTLDPKIIYASLGALSVGLRIFLMSTLRVPAVFIVLLNLVFITLFEANAIRLGMAATLVILGLFFLTKNRRVLATLTLLISMSFHLQVIIFIFPFSIFYCFSPWLIHSKVRILAVLAIFILGSFAFIQIIPLLGNEKIGEYISRGGSNSAGIGITSMIAAAFVLVTALTINKKEPVTPLVRFWAAIIAGAVPALTLLLFLTNISVIGDRAWQLALLMLSTFFFLPWVSRKDKMIALLLLSMTTMIMAMNVTIRYPLSNFLSPPLPKITGL